MLHIVLDDTHTLNLAVQTATARARDDVLSRLAALRIRR
jgi:hypothetical protein